MRGTFPLSPEEVSAKRSWDGLLKIVLRGKTMLRNDVTTELEKHWRIGKLRHVSIKNFKHKVMEHSVEKT